MLVGLLALLAEYKSLSLPGPQVCESSHADEERPWTLWLMHSVDVEVGTEERVTTPMLIMSCLKYWTMCAVR